MVGPCARWAGFVALVTLAWSSEVSQVPACDFCTMQGQTLVNEVEQASMVLFGTLANPRLDPNSSTGQGTTDLHIEAVIKRHDILGNQQVLTLPRYLPTDGDKAKFLIFCDVLKGKVDPYRGIPIRGSQDVVRYLKGAMALKTKPVPERLRYFFDFLDNADLEVSNDAYKAFGNASYPEFRAMAPDLPADKVTRWLQDPVTPPFRLGLYSSMLGHCGRDQHAQVLRKLLDDTEKRLTSGVDGMLAGYTLLRREEGWAYLRHILATRSGEFSRRYAALRAARFFHNSRPDVVEQKKVVEAVILALDDPSLADLAIEDLRKWACWDLTERVLALYGKPSHNASMVRRAILKFAMSSPKPEAAGFVKELRQKEPELVADTEEWIKLEAAASKPGTR